MCIVLRVHIILALTATLTDICAGQVLRSAGASRRRTVCFALASDHLHDGFWSWESICGSRFQPAICFFEVPILQGIQLCILVCDGCLSCIVFLIPKKIPRNWKFKHNRPDYLPNSDWNSGPTERRRASFVDRSWQTYIGSVRWPS